MPMIRDYNYTCTWMILYLLKLRVGKECILDKNIPRILTVFLFRLNAN